MSRPKTGIRKIEDVEAGAIAWLYGETDLDDVMVALAKHLDESNPCEWIDREWREAYAYPTGGSDEPFGSPAWEAWLEETRAWQEAGTYTIRDESPTSAVFFSAPREAEVGWFRKFPWCTCGEEHSWHYEPSAPGRGASLAVLVSWYF